MTAAVLDLAHIYEAHASWLESWLRRRTRCPQRAEDLVHDTFCRLLERGSDGSLRDPRSFLTVVARRLLIDDARRSRIEALYLEAVSVSSKGANHLTPEHIAAAIDELQAVLRLLLAMPEQIRDAFLLRRIDGLSHAEIAARLGISDRTVKRHIARAYAKCYAFAYPD